MNRSSRLILALAAVTLSGACASAGTTARNTEVAGPPNSENEWTREAESNLAVASLRSDPAQQRELYQAALEATQVGLQNDPQNPLLWLRMGQAYVGLDDYAGADSALAKAEELYPQFGEDIAVERENAWVEAYNLGVEALQRDDFATATAQMERADMIYRGRPEALINLGWLYSRQGDNERAVTAYDRGLEILRGPMPAQSTAQDSANWRDNERVVAFNLAQILTGVGIDRFEAEEYEAAAESFRAALELSPSSRDNLYNLAQTIYIQATDMEEVLDQADAARAAELRAQLRPLYEEVMEVVQRVRELDPNNSNALLILARAYRGMADLAADEATANTWRQRALDVLTQHQDMPFYVTDVQIATVGTGVRLVGTVQNVNLSAGAPIRLRVSFLDIAGAEVGSTEVSVAAPAPEETATFEATLSDAESVVGWKYTDIGQAS